MTEPTPTEELRTAAARLRETRNCDGFNVDCDSRELLDMIRVLLRAREPLAELLETAVPYLDRHNGVAYPTHVVYALTVARAVNAAAEPGPVRGGVILDRLTGGTT